VRDEGRTHRTDLRILELIGQEYVMNRNLLWPSNGAFIVDEYNLTLFAISLNDLAFRVARKLSH